MESIREKVVAAFAAKIDAQRAVQLDGECDLPARAVWDISETGERTTYGYQRNTLEINVGYMAKTNSDNPSVQGNAMIAEVIQDAQSDDLTLGGLTTSLTYTESTIDYPADGQREIAVLLAFEVVYEHLLNDPYSQ